MKFIQLALLVCCFAESAAYAADDCLRYQPAQVTLTGKLERKTFPGRPNYENIAEGDEPETHFYLALDKKICVTGDAKSDDVNVSQDNVMLVQLVLEKVGYERLQPLLGSSVNLSGQLFAAHTAHHHARLLMRKVAIVDSNGVRKKR